MFCGSQEALNIVLLWPADTYSYVFRNFLLNSTLKINYSTVIKFVAVNTCCYVKVACKQNSLTTSLEQGHNTQIRKMLTQSGLVQKMTQNGKTTSF